MFLSCFHSWRYILSLQMFSQKSVSMFIIVVHVFRNLIWKICTPFGQISITCLKCSKATYSKEMHWIQAWKRDSTTSVFMWILQKQSRTPSLENTSRRLLVKNFVFDSLMLLSGSLKHSTFIHNKCIISDTVYQKDSIWKLIYSDL